MNKAYICLGSNAPLGAAAIDAAVLFVAENGSIVADTGKYPTEPEYDPRSPRYLNRILVLETELNLVSLSAITKSYETQKRIEVATAESSQGCFRRYCEVDGPKIVAIDIDIVEWNGEILRPSDKVAAYYRKGISILDGLKSVVIGAL